MDNFFGGMNLQGNYALNILFALSFVWSTAWKGLGLWNAAKNKQQYWFVAMLIINTLGILEIVYLFRFATKRLTIKELLSLVKRG
ncbi:MAG: DUF5652 family protein [Candidatus Curtissbacteria bacterium]|nr:DUF5652 family protein [Candidatus Curtissbacteria bacterium]